MANVQSRPSSRTIGSTLIISLFAWKLAQLQEPILPKCLTRFRYDWQWTGKPAVLQSRCTDETGYVQPTLTALNALRFGRGIDAHYHLNAIQSWRVGDDGMVTNVHA